MKDIMLPIGNVRVPMSMMTDEQLIDWVRIVIGKDPHFSCDDTRGRGKGK